MNKNNTENKLGIENNILPNNFLAEQALLNILLTHPNNSLLLTKNLDNIKLEYFYNESHQILYSTILKIFEQNRIINITTLISELENQGVLQKIGGLEKIIKIIKNFENFSNLEEYIQLIKDKHNRRLIIELGKRYIELGYSTSISLNNIFSTMEESIFTLNQENNSDTIQSSAEILENIYKDLKHKKNSNIGLTTSFKDLDAIIQGFNKSDLIIIAGRPSMGKTAFSLNLAKNIVEKYKIPILIFTLEMSRQQIMYRFLSSESLINTNRLKTGKMTFTELIKLKESMIKLSNLSIFIDDNSNLTINDIRSKLKKIFIDSDKTGLVIIDYLQLMKLSFKLENRVQEISYLTRNLKLLAKEFNIPIILLSQLSRNVESRVNKRPMLSDLRESGCIVNSMFKNKNIFKSYNLIKFINIHHILFEFKGIKPTYLLTFENNIKIEITSNHKILSSNGWIKIAEINLKTSIYSLIKSKLSNSLETYKYNKIINIEYTGINYVYNKNVPNTHNYLYKNILLHNSIEQDSDIVIMLYRQDYYKEKSFEPQITELIVAKHRNGPTGTARVLFDPAIATFQNLP
jgi:replicative DNA helicase